MRYSLPSLAVPMSFVCVSLGIAAAGEGKALDGKWRVEIAMSGGRPVKDAVGEYAIFSRERVEETDKDGKKTDSGIVRTDVSVQPATIDVFYDRGGVNRGVFVIRGDSLEICWGGDIRPQSLDSSLRPDFSI